METKLFDALRNKNFSALRIVIHKGYFSLIASCCRECRTVCANYFKFCTAYNILSAPIRTIRMQGMRSGTTINIPQATVCNQCILVHATNERIFSIEFVLFKWHKKYLLLILLENYIATWKTFILDIDGEWVNLLSLVFFNASGNSFGEKRHSWHSMATEK